MQRDITNPSFARFVLCPQTPSGLWTPLGDFHSPNPFACCVHAPVGLCLHTCYLALINVLLFFD